MLGVGLLSFALGWVDEVFIWASLPLYSLGIYQMATMIYGFLLIAPLSLSTPLYPQLSELYGRHGRSILTESFKTASRYLSFTYIPLVFSSIVFSKQIVEILAGPSYSESTLPFMLMSFGALAYGFASILNLNLMTIGKTNDYLIVQALSFTCYLMILFTSVPRLGMVGASLCKASLGFMILFFGLMMVRRHIPIRFDREGLWKSLLSSVIATLPIFIFFRSGSILMFPLYLLLFFSVYLLSLIALKTIHEQDLKRLESFIPSSKRFIRILQRLS